MRTLLFLLMFNTSMCFAGDVVNLSPAEAGSMNFKFIAWPDSTPLEVAEIKHQAHCTPVAFTLPMSVSEKYPDWTQVLISGEVYLSGKALTTTGTYSYEINGENIAYVCFPFDPEYRVDLVFSYNPAEIGKMPLCPPTFELKDFKRFVDFTNAQSAIK